MTNDDSEDLLRKIEQGDSQACRQLVDQYVDRMIALARKNMSEKLRQKLDPEDVVQSALGSFFDRVKDGDFHLRESGSLWRLLAAITVNKVRRKAIFHQAAKRSFNSEVQIVVDDTISFANPSLEAIARDPSPEELSVLEESFERAMGELTEKQRRIVHLRLQGDTLDEIATRARCSRRAVERAIKAFREELEKQLGESYTNV